LMNLDYITNRECPNRSYIYNIFEAITAQAAASAKA
jgi:hypothetical protein